MTDEQAIPLLPGPRAFLVCGFNCDFSMKELLLHLLEERKEQLVRQNKNK